MKCYYCDKIQREKLSFENLLQKRDKSFLCTSCRENLNINFVDDKTYKRFYFADYSFIKDQIYNIKYFGDIKCSRKFKPLFKQFFDDYNFDLITTVPSNNTRKIIRGYNHIDLICQLCNIKTTELLCCNYREKQAKLHKKRSEHKFSLITTNIDSNKIKKILIIDDIYTSGNTLISCAKELQKYFQKSEIFFLTLANSSK